MKQQSIIQALRAVAMRLPETQEGIACAGTALEKRTIKVRKKAFLFLGAEEAMLKLEGSLGAASALAAQSPARCKVGARGWVTAKLGEPDGVPVEVLTGWIEESYRLFAPAGGGAKKGPRKRS